MTRYFVLVKDLGLEEVEADWIAAENGMLVFYEGLDKKEIYALANVLKVERVPE